MIQLSYLDYLAVEGKGWLHRISPGVKVMGVLVVLAGVVLLRNVTGVLVLYLLVFSLFVTARIPFTIFSLTLYPLTFAVLFVFVSWFQPRFILVIFLKVLSGSTSVVLLLATTPYPQVLRVLGKVLPSLFVTALFLTYRSLFILLGVLEETQHALYLRGGFQWSHPWRSLNNVANAFGHLIIKAIEASERMYESMTLRGFKGNIGHGGEGNDERFREGH